MNLNHRGGKKTLNRIHILKSKWYDISKTQTTFCWGFFLNSALIYVQPNISGPSFGPGELTGVWTKKLEHLTNRGAAESPRQVLTAPAKEREGAGHPLLATLEDANLINHQHCTNWTANAHSLHTHAGSQNSHTAGSWIAMKHRLARYGSGRETFHLSVATLQQTWLPLRS